MDAVVSLVRFNGDAVPAIGRALMTGLLVCERGHLIRWPRFAELERPRRVPLYTHTEFLDSADNLIVLDAQLYNSRSGGHRGSAEACGLPHHVSLSPSWRTWGPYNPHVFITAAAARLTVAQLFIGSPLREGVGAVWQAVTSRIVGFTPEPEFDLDILDRIAEIKEDYCPYCLSSALIRALNVRLAETRDEPDVVQGHLVGWRMGAMTKFPDGLMTHPRLLNHKFESWGCFGGAVILEDPRGLVVWSDANGFTVTSPDHEEVACGEGVWYFQHPLPGSVD